MSISNIQVFRNCFWDEGGAESVEGWLSGRVRSREGVIEVNSSVRRRRKEEILEDVRAQCLAGGGLVMHRCPHNPFYNLPQVSQAALHLVSRTNACLSALEGLHFIAKDSGVIELDRGE